MALTARQRARQELLKREAERIADETPAEQPDILLARFTGYNQGYQFTTASGGTVTAENTSTSEPLIGDSYQLRRDASSGRLQFAPKPRIAVVPVARKQTSAKPPEASGGFNPLIGDYDPSSGQFSGLTLTRYDINFNLAFNQAANFTLPGDSLSVRGHVAFGTIINPDSTDGAKALRGRVEFTTILSDIDLIYTNSQWWGNWAVGNFNFDFYGYNNNELAQDLSPGDAAINNLLFNIWDDSVNARYRFGATHQVYELTSSLPQHLYLWGFLEVLRRDAGIGRL